MHTQYFLVAWLTFTIGTGALVAAPAAGTPGHDLAQVLRQTPAAEMPAKAAELVGAAPPRQREKVAFEAVKAGLELNPNAAAALAGALSKAAPEAAPAVAGAAAQLKPQLAPVIARAAAGAAPTLAGKIVLAVCRAVPADYRRIAVAVSQVAPGADKEILKAVAAAIPSLKETIHSLLTRYSSKPVSVAVVLDSPNVTAAAARVGTGFRPGAEPRGPTLAPPYVPYSGTASGLAPSNTGPVSRGGRNYAAP